MLLWIAIILAVVGLALYFVAVWRSLPQLKEEIRSGTLTITSLRKTKITELVLFITATIILISGLLVLAGYVDVYLMYFSIAVVIMTIIASFLTLQQVAQGVNVFKAIESGFKEMLSMSFTLRVLGAIIGTILWLVLAAIVFIYPFLLFPAGLLLLVQLFLALFLSFLIMWIWRKLSEIAT